MTESTNADALILRLHVWFERDEQIFLGIGRAMLLDKIEQYGSLRQAATEMKMSYRAAWRKLSVWAWARICCSRADSMPWRRVFLVASSSFRAPVTRL